MKLTQLQRRNLRRALVQLSKDGPSDDTMGICYNLNQRFEQAGSYLDVYSVVARYGAKWPARTGKLDVITRDAADDTSTYPIAREFDGSGCRLPLWEGAQREQRTALVKYMLDNIKGK